MSRDQGSKGYKWVVQRKSLEGENWSIGELKSPSTIDNLALEVLDKS